MLSTEAVLGPGSSCMGPALSPSVWKMSAYHTPSCFAGALGSTFRNRHSSSDTLTIKSYAFTHTGVKTHQYVFHPIKEKHRI